MAGELCEDKSRRLVSTGGFCYSGGHNPSIQSDQFMNQIQGFESHPAEIFNLTTGMEMIGFSKNMNASGTSNSALWKGQGVFAKPTSHQGPSSSKGIAQSGSDFYHHEFTKPDFTGGISETSSENHPMAGASDTTWHENRLFLVDDSSLRCVFPCEGNERPSQGLSLSLSSSNPSTIGLQSFELRQTTSFHQEQQDADFRFVSRDHGYLGKSGNTQQNQILQDGFLGKDVNIHHQQGHFQLRSSKYLGPAQELLNEFCSLGTKLNDGTKLKASKMKQWEEDNSNANNASSSSSRRQPLQSLDFMELQKRKTKLFSMLEELERKYRNYCDQMKAVVSSFEAVAGKGAATVYSALASKAMSRHFRCLKDGIVNQIQATKKAMGEKDPVAPGTTRGETPRLRILDQALRQQRAFQQMSMMESHPWRPQRGLPERSVSVLRAWLFEHFLHPYPSDVDKHILARQTGLSRSQVSNWFINARVRLWKPMVEEMYVEELKEQENSMTAMEGSRDLDENGRPNPSLTQARPEDQKPAADQLLRIDSDCLSTVITNPDKPGSKSSKPVQIHHHHHQNQQQNFGRVSEAFGPVELDFSTYNHNSASQNFGSSGNGVSLTLGLQQHGGNGMSLAFSPASQGSLFFGRDHMDECQPSGQFSLLDGEAPNLPYRNLMGAQLLHDLAG